VLRAGHMDPSAGGVSDHAGQHEMPEGGPSGELSTGECERKADAVGDNKPALAARFRVRTITTGIDMASDVSRWAHQLRKAVEFNNIVKAKLEGMGYEVQTTRITTNSFEEWMDLTSSDTAIAAAGAFCDCLHKAGGDDQLVNIGPCTTLVGAGVLPTLLLKFAPLFASARVGCSGGCPNRDMLAAAAAVTHKLSTDSEGGEACFKFAASFNCPPGIPFFPAGASPVVCGLHAVASSWCHTSNVRDHRVS